MYDYPSLKKLYNYICNENNDNCKKCAETKEGRCYAPDEPTLFFDTSDRTEIVFISESPYNYPNKTEKNSQEFVCSLSSNYLKCAAKIEKAPDSRPRNIFGFIYNVFRPVFQSAPQERWGESLLNSVYWTHAGKKSFKPRSSKPLPMSKRLECTKQCAHQLLIEELKAIRPKLVIIASNVATRVLLGKGFGELFDEQTNKTGPFLSLQEACTHDSLLREALDKGSFPKNWSCGLAIFPNPSPACGRWKNFAYCENRDVVSSLISSIHNELHKHLNSHQTPSGRPDSS